MTKTRLFIGIDGGLNGGIAGISDDDSIEFMDIMPVIKGKRSVYNITEIVKLFKHAQSRWDIKRVCLEDVFAPQQGGTTTALKIGDSFGTMKGVLSALGIPYETTRPQAWQKLVFAGNGRHDTKQSSLLTCQRMWPEEDFLASDRSRKPHDGLTDALCLALYAKRTHG